MPIKHATTRPESRIALTCDQNYFPLEQVHSLYSQIVYKFLMQLKLALTGACGKRTTAKWPTKREV